MPDLLAHALIAYALLRVAAPFVDRLETPQVTAGMAGAFVPDLVKAKLLVSSAGVEAILGVPFSWEAINSAGGAAVCVLVGVVLVPPDERRRTGAALGVGAATHLFTDALLLTPSGRSFAVFFPFSRYNPPTPGLYLSTQPGPTVAAALAAAIAWGLARFVRRRRRGESADRGG